MFQLIQSRTPFQLIEGEAETKIFLKEIVNIYRDYYVGNSGIPFMFSDFYLERLYDKLNDADFFENNGDYQLLKAFYPTIDDSCSEAFDSPPPGIGTEMVELTIHELCEALFDKHQHELMGDIILALDLLNLHYCHVADEDTHAALLATRGEFHNQSVKGMIHPSVHHSTKGGFSCMI